MGGAKCGCATNGFLADETGGGGSRDSVLDLSGRRVVGWAGERGATGVGTAAVRRNKRLGGTDCWGRRLLGQDCGGRRGRVKPVHPGSIKERSVGARK